MSFAKCIVIFLAAVASASMLPSSHKGSISHKGLSSQKRDAEGLQRGDMTWFHPGLGACGNYNSDSDLIAAVSTGRYDQGVDGNPNNSPICGRKINIYYWNNYVQVTVVDRCEGCGWNDVDLSPAAFSFLAGLGEGRLKSVFWDFD